jgi:hypothetical protein
MKAVFVTTNLKGGGAEKAVLGIASGLAARGHAGCTSCSLSACWTMRRPQA